MTAPSIAFQRQPNEARAHERLYELLRKRHEPYALERLLAEGAKMTEEEARRMAIAD